MGNLYVLRKKLSVGGGELYRDLGFIDAGRMPPERLQKRLAQAGIYVEEVSCERSRDTDEWADTILDILSADSLEDICVSTPDRWVVRIGRLGDRFYRYASKEGATCAWTDDPNEARVFEGGEKEAWRAAQEYTHGHAHNLKDDEE